MLRRRQESARHAASAAPHARTGGLDALTLTLTLACVSNPNPTLALALALALALTLTLTLTLTQAGATALISATPRARHASFTSASMSAADQAALANTEAAKVTLTDYP